MPRRTQYKDTAEGKRGRTSRMYWLRLLLNERQAFWLRMVRGIQPSASLYFYTLKDGLPVHRSVLSGLEREGWLTRETVTVAGIYKRWKLTPKGERQLQGLKTDEQ